MPAESSPDLLAGRIRRATCWQAALTPLWSGVSLSQPMPRRAPNLFDGDGRQCKVADVVLEGLHRACDL